MNVFRKSALAFVASTLVAATAQATIVISISANRLEIADGSAPIVGGTLLQLVNLGGDGIFNPINLGDGNVSQFGQWVSGDDTLLNIAFTIEGAPGDFPSTAAFDLRKSGSPEPTSGIFTRLFGFDSGAISNLKLGLRWFPGLQATDFSTTTLQMGQSYGEFTRQAATLNGGQVWNIGAAQDGSFQFDSLLTSSEVNGGRASLSVVPEPAAIGMSLLGAAGLAMLRRRRA